MKASVILFSEIQTALRTYCLSELQAEVMSLDFNKSNQKTVCTFSMLNNGLVIDILGDNIYLTSQIYQIQRGLKKNKDVTLVQMLRLKLSIISVSDINCMPSSWLWLSFSW